MKGPWVKLWRNVFADEVVSFCMRRYGHETAIMWIGILSQADDGVLLMDEDVFADLIQIEENRYRELRGILIKRGLIIENEQGLLEVPNWNEYQTGQSTERARACRERRKDATLRNGCATEKQR
ncbi:MAG: phage replisome organizer N-terminal domain-containing protein, partial [Spirochaetes bacterium]|nr:phage replisome organizer N-terminal domain-containing protein [Spirochaetota bacterium]